MEIKKLNENKLQEIEGGRDFIAIVFPFPILGDLYCIYYRDNGETICRWI